MEDASQRKINKRLVGTEKEEQAMEYLRGQGFRIVAHSFRCRMGEIDIIAEEGETLVFVEVKYRKDSSASGRPEEAVTYGKQRTLSRVALYYLTTRKKRTDIPCRFDVIAIDGEELRHHRNAFPYRP